MKSCTSCDSITCNLFDLPMRVNIGAIDRTIRLLLASLLGVLYSLRIISHGLEYLLLGTAIQLILTGITRRCPLYYFLDLDTREKM